MKKILLLLFIIFLTGCTSYYKDINNLAIIDEIAIDYSTNYNISIKVLSNNQEKNNKIYNETCEKLNECFNELNNKLTKKLYLTHLNLLIFSNNLQKENYKEIMNYFINESTSRNTFTTIMVDKINENLLNLDSKDIKNLLSLSNKSVGLASDITFDNIIKDILNFNLSYIPVIINNEVVGYKTIYEEEKLLSKDESITLNFIFNKINNISLLINDKSEKLEDCSSIYKNDNNNLSLTITCSYHGKNEKEIKHYLENNINSFLNNNKNNYFNYLKEKYGINKNSNIISKIVLIKKEIDSGDYFE